MTVGSGDAVIDDHRQRSDRTGATAHVRNALRQLRILISGARQIQTSAELHLVRAVRFLSQ